MTISIRRAAATAAAAILLAITAIGLAQAATPAAAPVGAPVGAPRVAAPATTNDAAAGGGIDLTLASDIEAILAADPVAAAPTAASGRGLAAGPLRRLAAARRVVHATVVLDLKTGLATVQVDHGTISAVGATSLTIAETGGGKPSVTLGSETRVRRNGAKAAIGDLKVGDEVFALSKVAADGTIAYLVVVPKA